ncbi:three-Cys-motif partner protein TcmP [bacterium]|nr:three-Cys-motif partner protein TcmP [bacterium]
MERKNQQYWNEYSNLQHTKHKIIHEYLNGWFPKLGLWAGKILYLDTHAGRGKHSTGEEGSPLVALRTLLEHRARDRILQKSEVNFVFIERNKENYKRLERELSIIEYPTSRIKIKIINSDSFKFLDNLYTQLEQLSGQLAPCFMFIDPYGFKMPCELLQQIMQHQRSELLVTIMWRELDMSIIKEPKGQGIIRTLNEVFGCKDWQNITSIHTSDMRAEAACGLLKEQIGAKWSTYIKMLDRGRTRYLLLHLTNHDDGRDLFKNVLWNCCPEGGWFARKSDDPKQYRLFKPEPDLSGLHNWVVDILKSKDYTWNELAELVREEIWLPKHLWQIVRKLRNDGRMEATNFEGRFSQKANPTLRLVKD